MIEYQEPFLFLFLFQTLLRICVLGRFSSLDRQLLTLYLSRADTVPGVSSSPRALQGQAE